MDLIKKTLKNQYVTTFLSIIILLYSATINNISIKNNQFKFYSKIFNHHFFRVIYLLLILYLFDNDIKLAIALSIAFIMMNISVTNNMVKSSFGQFENFIELEHFSDDYKYNKKILS
jgi:hypothetical protein